MKTTSKWVDFYEIEMKGKITKTFQVATKNGDGIGRIKWFSNWRQYCFFPDENTLYNSECMKDVSEFIDGLMQERKER